MIVFIRPSLNPRYASQDRRWVVRLGLYIRFSEELSPPVILETRGLPGCKAILL